MKKYLFAGALAATSLAVSAPLAAKNVTADLDQIAEIMRDEGLQAKIENDDGRRYIVSGMSGYTFQVLDYGCDDDGKNCKWVQFRVAFSPDTKPTLEAVNKFAADNFFGRFYIDDEKDPVMEIDIDLEAGGMSRALFVDNIAYFDSVMTKYAEFVFANDE